MNIIEYAKTEWLRRGYNKTKLWHMSNNQLMAIGFSFKKQEDKKKRKSNAYFTPLKNGGVTELDMWRMENPKELEGYLFEELD